MKYRNLLLVVLLIGLLPLLCTNGQATSRRSRSRQKRSRRTRKVEVKPKVKTGNTNKVEFNLCYDFSMQAIPSRMSFVTVIPKTIPDRQEILDIQYSTEPSRVFNNNGSHYAEFVFPRPPTKFNLKINVKAVLFRYDLFTTQKKYRQNPPPQDPNMRIGDFLKHEKYIEKDNPQIQQIAESIKGQTREILVEKLYEYVTNNMEYVNYNQELGAVKAARKKRGACTEYSDLFVALCRAKGIPARVVKGYVTEPVYSPQHAWAEVHLQKYGWVPFDLTYGDVKEKSAKSKRFKNLKPIYIYLTNIRNDPLLEEAISVRGIWIGEIKMQDSIEFR